MNAWDVFEQLFHWLVQTSGRAAVIVLIILLAQFLLRHRLSPAWRYGLWFLPGERRFLQVCDGSNGRMSGRFGWHGPNGTTSSGMN